MSQTVGQEQEPDCSGNTGNRLERPPEAQLRITVPLNKKSFVSIAERPDFNAEKVASFLLEPHLKMPKHGANPTSHSVVFPQR
jgi:hypothetical protein